MDSTRGKPGQPCCGGKDWGSLACQWFDPRPWAGCGSDQTKKKDQALCCDMMGKLKWWISIKPPHFNLGGIESTLRTKCPSCVQAPLMVASFSFATVLFLSPAEKLYYPANQTLDLRLLPALSALLSCTFLLPSHAWPPAFLGFLL